MKRETLKDSIYGGLAELVKNNKIYYHSSIGKDYSKLTETGKIEILKWVETQAKEVAETEKKFLEEQAKQLVINTLKQ